MTSGTTACVLTAVQPGNADYTPATNVQRTVAATKAMASVTVNGYSGVYDGQPHGASGSATGVGGSDLGSALSLGATFTSVPGGTAHWTFSGGANYTSQSGDVAIAISKASVTATAGGGSATYDGFTHSPSSCAVTGAFVGDLSCANSPASVGPSAGSTVIAPIVAGTGLSNFSVTTTNGSYTIGQASSTTTVACPTSVPYTGGAQTPCSVTVTGAGLNVSPAPGYSNNVGVGTASASYVFNGDANHTGSSDSKNFAIAKAATTIAIVSDSPDPSGVGQAVNVTWSYAVVAPGGGTPTGSVTVSDGVDSCVGTLASGGCVITLNSTGVRTLAATYGGDGSFTGSVSPGAAHQVNGASSFAFTGFFSPIDMPQTGVIVWNTSKAGQAIPTKWALTLNGTPVSDPHSFVELMSYPVSCSTGTGNIETAIEEFAPGNTGLQYLGNGNWQFNWKTSSTYKGTCRVMFVRFSDGTSSAGANFKFN
jgi:hypothetical protein